MQTSDTHTAIRELEKGSREQGFEIPIDPTCEGSSSQGLTLRGPEAGQPVVLSTDSVESMGYGASGPAGRCFAVIGWSNPTRPSDRFGRSSAGAVCLAISVWPLPTPPRILSRSDAPSCRKSRLCSPRTSELRA